MRRNQVGTMVFDQCMFGLSDVQSGELHRKRTRVMSNSEPFTESNAWRRTPCWEIADVPLRAFSVAVTGLPTKAMILQRQDLQAKRSMQFKI